MTRWWLRFVGGRVVLVLLSEGEIVVVFDGLKGGGLAEEAEMVNGNGNREERLYC